MTRIFIKKPKTFGKAMLHLTKLFNKKPQSL